MGLLSKLLFFPVTGPIAGIKWSMGQLQTVVEEQLTDDQPVKQELMELQMQLELGDITDDEYVEREAALMTRLREVRVARTARQGQRRRPGPGLAPRRGGVTALDQLVGRLPRVTLVVGKGGVGKTTIAAGIAVALAKAGTHTLVLTTDPAGTLADAVRLPGARRGSLAPTPLREHLDLWVIDAAAARDAFLDQWRATIATILDRGTYLDKDDIDGLVDAALPGADEIFALLALGDLLGDPHSPYDRIIVDTAPTGHTLRLLELPTTFAALVALLDAMQEKHRFMVRALTHRYRGDDADRFLTNIRERVDRTRALFTHRTQAGAILVTRNEPVVLAETARYAAALAAASVSIIATVVNASDGSPSSIGEALADVKGNHYVLGRVEPPRDLDQAAAMVNTLGEIAPAAGRAPHVPPPRRGAKTAAKPSAGQLPNILPLTIVAGKGGVGKTTVACALAIRSADDGQRTLLVSTDPAPSVADALDQPIGDDEIPVDGAPGLVARQMDATAAFVRFRTEYQGRIDDVFSGLTSRGLDAAHDRTVLRDLLSLAPPGIDEVYALSVLGDALAGGAFDRIIVDPAPTGHLLRLLDMPSVALDWTHRLMRLMLKYKEVVTLGDSAQELLGFAKRTRALESLLHEPTQCAVIAVGLDEPLVRAESERLAAELGARGLSVAAFVWNRCAEQPTPLPVDRAISQLAAPIGSVVGVTDLRRWSALWTFM